MMAAQGVLAPRAHEQLGLLVLLSADADPAIRAATEATISRIPAPDLARFIGRPDVAHEIRDFFAGRGIEPVVEDVPVSDEPLLDVEAGRHRTRGARRETTPAAERKERPARPGGSPPFSASP